MITVIKNGKVILPDKVLNDACVVLEEGKIIGIGAELPENADKIIDAEGSYVSPGFIDMHTHGGDGYLFIDGTEEAIRGACSLHLKHGTTSIVPTISTCPHEELFELFKVYRGVKAAMNGPEMLGIHLEGPYFAPSQCGAQNTSFMKTPKPEDYMPVLDAGGKDIIRMSVAPELDGGMELGDELARRGILASIGHSDANYDEVKEAIGHGYTHVTHLYSGMSMLHRVNAYRVLGIVESAYLFDELTVEIIADGKHLPPELLRLILKNKAHESISLVTDSIRPAGLPDGTVSFSGTAANPRTVYVENGVAMMPDRQAFAGSVCTSDRCIRTMHEQAGLSICEAVCMMTCNPAKVLKVDDCKGSIAVGKDADICIFDENVNVSKVFVGGRLLADNG